jgi:hypothetical protein
MAMQTDVKSSYLTATGTAFGQRTRLKGLYVNTGGSAATVEFTNGNGGTSLMKVDAPASATGNPVYIIVPGEGILFEASLYAVITGAASVTVFYG